MAVSLPRASWLRREVDSLIVSKRVLVMQGVETRGAEGKSA